jgi:hypothetical protein
MRHALMRSFGVAFCVLSAAVDAHAADPSGWRCTGTPVEACVTRRGRLSSQNGIARRIWVIGTKRTVGVSETVVPASIEKYLEMTSDDHSQVYGDFEICPLEPDAPGRMQSVCVSGASRLVVQNLRRPRPPFRLRSTWPAGER